MTKHPVYHLAALVLTFLTVMTLSMTMPASESAAFQLGPHLHKNMLDNGLTVIVQETPGVKVATVQIWVNAGSVYEEPHEAGITHLIEHMIFKGTAERGPGELAGAIEAVGGQVNAYTSFENTVYHATLSARHWRLALEVLADAVRHSVFDPDELEREKKVVLEELGMRNDRPNIRLFQTLMDHAYAVHPYRLPVIGNEAALMAMSRADLINYVGKHYHPENFTVVVVGDVAAPEVLRAVADVMGNDPRGGQPPPPALPTEPSQQAPRHFKIEADINQPQMAVALPISPFASPDSPVLDVIAQILGHGEASRLYQALRDDQGLIYAIDASAFTPSDPGLFEIFATLDEAKMIKALESLLTELFTLKYRPVSATELQRAKLQLESDFLFSQERVEGRARVLGSFELMSGDPSHEGYLEAIRAVDGDTIMRVASRYFKGERLTAGFLVPPDSGVAPDNTLLANVVSRAEQAAEHGDASAAPLADAFLSNTHRYVLANGMILLVREEPTVPTVAIRVVMPGGLRAETVTSNGAFAFISELLPKGTERMTARQLSEAIADMAGNITGFNGKNTFGLQADFLPRFLGQGLGLVRDILLFPAFEPTEAEKIRSELLAQLKQQQDSLTSLAFREFNRILFNGHPYGLNTAGSEEAIRSLSIAELQTIYAAYARPDHMVLAVAGAVKAEAVRDLVDELFGQWAAPQAATASEISEDILPPAPYSRPRTFTVARDKEQVHLVIGFLGTTLYDQDRFNLEVLDTVLSGQSGRLFVELRDKQSLAYSLSSFALFGLDTGSFGIYIGTSPDKKEQALDEVWKQLARVRREEIGPEELERAKNILISRYELSLQTHSAQALEMGLNETYGLGQDYGAKYIEALRAVNGQSVLAAAQKYIHPDQHVMVMVGADTSAPASDATSDDNISGASSPTGGSQ